MRREQISISFRCESLERRTFALQLIDSSARESTVGWVEAEFLLDELIIDLVRTNVHSTPVNLIFTAEVHG